MHMPLVRSSLSVRLIATSAVLVSMGLPISARAETAQPADVGTQSQAAPAQAAYQDVRPLQFHPSDEELADRRRRMAATKWPSRELVTDATQGVQLETMQKLAQYWANDYDWRRMEAKLNALPQFVTN